VLISFIAFAAYPIELDSSGGNWCVSQLLAARYYDVPFCTTFPHASLNNSSFIPLINAFHNLPRVLRRSVLHHLSTYFAQLLLIYPLNQYSSFLAAFTSSILAETLAACLPFQLGDTLAEL
jgi:hypothetical protein